MTATTAGTSAGDSNGDSRSVQSYIPGADSEPENAPSDPEDWDDELKVAALDEEDNQLPASEENSDLDRLSCRCQC